MLGRNQTVFGFFWQKRKIIAEISLKVDTYVKTY